MIDLIVRAKHFKDANFRDSHSCAIAKAAKEHFGGEPNEGVNHLAINYPNRIIEYMHEYYGNDNYLKDAKKARIARFFGNKERVIRVISLKQTFNLDERI